MMTIAVTLSGQTNFMAVENINFVVKCHYHRCTKDPDHIDRPGYFLTIDPDKRYCVKWHKVKQSIETRC